MRRRTLIFDTSVLCVLLRIPGKDTCGKNGNYWDYDKAFNLIESEKTKGSVFVLPLAAIIETGNHISQTRGDRYALANELMRIVDLTLNDEEPWAAFYHQQGIWHEDAWRKLIKEWPWLAASGLSLGDATIRDVAEYFAATGAQVEIVTGDNGLKAYESAGPAPVPRRRQEKA